MLSFEGVRISDHGEFEVIVRRDGLRHVVRLRLDGSRVGSPSYGDSIESFAKEKFEEWVRVRKLSHAGTDMA